MVDAGVATESAVVVGIEGAGVGVVDGEEHFSLVVTAYARSYIVAGVGGVDIYAVEEVFTDCVGTKGTTV